MLRRMMMVDDADDDNADDEDADDDADDDDDANMGSTRAQHGPQKLSSNEPLFPDRSKSCSEAPASATRRNINMRTHR